MLTTILLGMILGFILGRYGFPFKEKEIKWYKKFK
jgi:hypothetical protein